MVMRGRRDSIEQRQAAQLAVWLRAGVDKVITSDEAYYLTQGEYGVMGDAYPENLMRLVDLAVAYTK